MLSNALRSLALSALVLSPSPSVASPMTVPTSPCVEVAVEVAAPSQVSLVAFLVLAVCVAVCMAAHFTITELMERWKCTRDTVLAKIHSGRLRAINVSNTNNRPRWRIPAEAVETYEQANESPAWNAAPKPSRRKTARSTKEYV